jgi:flagellar protein FlbD
MIKVTRLNGKEFIVNSDLIEFVESTPDTVITLTTGTKIVVKETVNEIIDKVIQFKSDILNFGNDQ